MITDGPKLMIDVNDNLTELCKWTYHWCFEIGINLCILSSCNCLFAFFGWQLCYWQKSSVFPINWAPEKRFGECSARVRCKTHSMLKLYVLLVLLCLPIRHFRCVYFSLSVCGSCLCYAAKSADDTEANETKGFTKPKPRQKGTKYVKNIHLYTMTKKKNNTLFNSDDMSRRAY